VHATRWKQQNVCRHWQTLADWASMQNIQHLTSGWSLSRLHTQTQPRHRSH